MSSNAPERIWRWVLKGAGGFVDYSEVKITSENATEYIRADIAQARIAELEAALRESLAVIDDYLEYEHDGDPWTEDARTMGEMGIDHFKRNGGLDRARAALGANSGE